MILKVADATFGIGPWMISVEVREGNFKHATVPLLALSLFWICLTVLRKDERNHVISAVLCIFIAALLPLFIYLEHPFHPSIHPIHPIHPSILHYIPYIARCLVLILGRGRWKDSIRFFLLVHIILKSPLAIQDNCFRVDKNSFQKEVGFDP